MNIWVTQNPDRRLLSGGSGSYNFFAKSEKN